MTQYLFFDNASTTKCDDGINQLIQQFACEDFGNPSSSHAFGQRSARAIREARRFFSNYFRVQPEQIIFTGSGTEANNLAIYGICLNALRKKRKGIRILYSSIEHPSVRKAIESLTHLCADLEKAQERDLNIYSYPLPITPEGQMDSIEFQRLLTPETLFISIHQVNNIIGSQIPIEQIAQEAKKIHPHLIFHTDAVQAFGKVEVPKAPSPIDLVSISAHKIGGPKGVGALIVLNKKLLNHGPYQSILRPLIWGGDQENGFRSGTQNAGLIAGFHQASQLAIQQRIKNFTYVSSLRELFERRLCETGLFTPQCRTSPIHLNSPPNSIPYIVHLSAPGCLASPLSRLLEERKCLVSVGSACSSKKAEPDAVLRALGKSLDIQTSGIRISFSKETQAQDIETLVWALQDSIRVARRLQPS